MSESAFNSAWRSYLHTIEQAINGHAQRAKGGAGWVTFDIRPHDLRHSYCTMLRDAGVDIKLAMSWLGHADEKMILRIYDHITESRTRSGMEKLEKLIASTKGSKRGSKPIKRTATR